MSPSTLRRYRAERRLRQDFEGLRSEVVATVRGRLRARGVSVDESDLEACYAQAWQGLYAAMVAGETIAHPAGWLTVVTLRRALDEHRTRRASAERTRANDVAAAAAAAERDFASELDDRGRLRHLFEGLRGRLSARECEAAALCYLQGCSRAEAAARMGISETRMRKLMEGPGGGRPGVAGKVGELLETIRAGGWCEQQASTMRGLAFGVLDPAGERYRLALAHQRECPACRTYILSLRGLAATLPPLALPWGLGAGAAAGAGAGAGAGVHASAAGAGAPAGVAAPAGTAAGSAVGAGGLSASGAAGVGGAAGGAAGGGWLLAGGSVGAKLAVGCLLALSVGCVALTTGPLTLPHPAHEHRRDRSAAAAGAQHDTGGYASASELTTTLSDTGTGHAFAQGRSLELERAAADERVASTPAAHAAREFGPEQALSPNAGSTSTATAARTVQRASVARDSTASAVQPSPSVQPASAAGSSQATPSGGSSAGGGSAAAREFGIG
jgi:DNA-directed RNA polymerase specialized sigma24 family protein